MSKVIGCEHGARCCESCRLQRMREGRERHYASVRRHDAQPLQRPKGDDRLGGRTHPLFGWGW